MFERGAELEQLRRKLGSRRSFLLHGPAGVGKTLLVTRLLDEFPSLLYCPNSSSSPTIFRDLAAMLARGGNPVAVRALGSTSEKLRSKSAVAVKGIVSDALQSRGYTIILDHCAFPSQGLASAIKEVAGWTKTPVMAIARSAHMEDAGFLLSMFPERGERMELKNLQLDKAAQFAHEMARRQQLAAENLSEFIERVAELSGGNPGSIISMIEMAHQPRYRSAEKIKITTLYVDFRIKWNAATHA